VPSRDVVLVIGGTGFIGRVLVSQLVEEGCEVRILTRRDGHPTRNGISYLRGDVADPAGLGRAIKDVQVVYDLSLGGGPTWDDHLRGVVQGAENVARACLEHGVRRLIYTSSIAALDLSRDRTIDESAGVDRKPHLRNLYARGKVHAERVLTQLHDEGALPVVIFRPGIVVGAGNKLSHPGIGNWQSPTFCEALGSGRTPLPLVLVEDVARALLLAKDAPGIEGRAFNLVGDVRLSAVEYVEAAGQRTLRNFRLRPTSLAGLQAFELLLWLAKAVLRPETNSWPSYYELKVAAKKAQIDCSAAKSVLGWRPVADREEFLERAMDCHVVRPRPGDLRLNRARAKTILSRPASPRASSAGHRAPVSAS
jgi:nucleoside-diphosphate-sugar epimerase